MTAIVDEFPHIRKKKTYLMLAACFIGYLLGFTCITRVSKYFHGEILSCALLCASIVPSVVPSFVCLLCVFCAVLFASFVLSCASKSWMVPNLEIKPIEVKMRLHGSLSSSTYPNIFIDTGYTWLLSKTGILTWCIYKHIITNFF